MRRNRERVLRLFAVDQAYPIYYGYLADWNPRPIDLSNNTYTFIVTFFIYFLFFFTFFYRALAALGFGSSLPFCAEKRSSLLHESEGIFVALLGKHPFIVTKARRLSWCCATVLRANTIGDSAGDEASTGLRPVPAT
jgi:hypothetical protein